MHSTVLILACFSAAIMAQDQLQVTDGARFSSIQSVLNTAIPSSLHSAIQDEAVQASIMMEASDSGMYPTWVANLPEDIRTLWTEFPIASATQTGDASPEEIEDSPEEQPEEESQDSDEPEGEPEEPEEPAEGESEELAEEEPEESEEGVSPQNFATRSSSPIAAVVVGGAGVVGMLALALGL